MATFFFCGIGGIGMSSIALYLKKSGHTVLGSDRSFDQKTNQKMLSMLENAGILIFPQDGSGVTHDVNTLVISTAVEETIPDVRAARNNRIPIRRRAEVLADILHQRTGIAVGGTSGKTTITAMIGHILHETEKDPLMINGGISVNAYDGNPPSNLMFGQGPAVIEADESDGSIELYHPDIALVANISLDHKPLEVIRPLFQEFINRATKAAIINWDDQETKKLTPTQRKLISFSSAGDSHADIRATQIHLYPDHIDFEVNKIPARLHMIGQHNVENALAALAACEAIGIPLAQAIEALTTFKGTARRMQRISPHNSSILVFDDYAHNPAKVQAALRSLTCFPGRTFAIFQPHGFAPTRLMKESLIQVLKKELSPEVTWIMPDIYYAGGTVAKDISSQEIINPLAQAGKNAVYIPCRTDIIPFLETHVQPGDRILVMGARDNSLTQFAEQIVTCLRL